MRWLNDNAKAEFQTLRRMIEGHMSEKLRLGGKPLILADPELTRLARKSMMQTEAPRRRAVELVQHYSVAEPILLDPKTAADFKLDPSAPADLDYLEAMKLLPTVDGP